MGSRVTLETRLNCPSKIFVRPGEIRQVFGNLISNALDSIGPGGGTLCVRCFDTTDQQTKRKGVRFFFSDTGAGIPDDVLPHIFDAFFTTKGSKGSGVGLWLSVDLLTKHHGHIRVRTRTSGRYRGTLFAIFLPSHT